MPPLPWPIAACMRGQEADGQEAAADDPDAGRKRRQRIGVAGGAALLNRLQSLADGFAVVIGGATGRARFFDRVEIGPIASLGLVSNEGSL